MKKIIQQFKITFYFFVFSIGLIITFIFIDMKFFSNQVQKTAMANAIEKIKEKELKLSSYFKTSENILYSINESKYFNNYLKKDFATKKEITEFFLTITNINKSIMQFRYIDSNGYEKIRIDRKSLNNESVIVSDSMLQNKSNRYYFNDRRNKIQNRVWFSNLDLNVENGKVVRPYVPTLRAILPVYRNKVFRGILIINYFMEEALSQLSQTTLYDAILLNDHGEILTHYDRSKSWTSYKNGSSNNQFIQDFPIENKNIINNSLYINENFVSKELNFNTPKKLIYLIQFKKKYLQKSQDDKLKEYTVVSSIIIFLSLIMSYVFSKYFRKVFFLLKDSKKLNHILGVEVDEKTKQLEELNANLEVRIEEEIKKNKQKDEKIFSQAKHVAMGEMLANIAHQWRQPLSLISTNASGVKLKYLYEQLDYKELPEQMDVIIDRTQYLSSTIDTFRNFLIEDKEHKQIILQESVNNAIDIMSGSLKANYISIENKIDTNRPISLYTIGSDLTEVLINIFTNARDVLLHRSISDASISINLDKSDTYVCIIIEDNAGGIEEHNLTRIFEPYFTTKHKSQGTGLGLHMSYKIVTESLNGSIYAKNSSRGAKFFIELPLS